MYALPLGLFSLDSLPFEPFVILLVVVYQLPGVPYLRVAFDKRDFRLDPSSSRLSIQKESVRSHVWVKYNLVPSWRRSCVQDHFLAGNNQSMQLTRAST